MSDRRTVDDHDEARQRRPRREVAARYLELERELQTATLQFLALRIPSRQQLDAQETLVARIRRELAQLETVLFGESDV